jgi:hypothetical protein
LQGWSCQEPQRKYLCDTLGSMERRIWRLSTHPAHPTEGPAQRTDGFEAYDPFSAPTLRLGRKHQQRRSQGRILLRYVARSWAW